MINDRKRLVLSKRCVEEDYFSLFMVGRNKNISSFPFFGKWQLVLSHWLMTRLRTKRHLTGRRICGREGQARLHLHLQIDRAIDRNEPRPKSLSKPPQAFWICKEVLQVLEISGWAPRPFVFSHPLLRNPCIPCPRKSSPISLFSHRSSFIFLRRLFFSGTKRGWENRKWVCFVNRMQLGLWPSSRIALLLKVETYSVPVSSCPKPSTSSIPEGTFCFCCLIFFAKFLRFHLQIEINN